MDSARIMELHGRSPLQPFDLRTADGRVYRIDRPEFLLQTRGRQTVVVQGPDDRCVTLDVRHVVAVDVAGAPFA